MRKSRFIEEQIVGVLKEAEAGGNIGFDEFLETKVMPPPKRD